MKMSAPLTIRAVTSLEDFKGLAQEWEQLLSTVAGHSLFLTWEWLHCWAKHYLGDHRLRILLALDEHQRLVGVAPLYLRTTRVQGLMSVRDLRFLGSESVCSSYLDVIVNETLKRALLQGLNGYLFSQARRDWDISPSLRCLLNLPRSICGTSCLTRRGRLERWWVRPAAL